MKKRVSCKAIIFDMDGTIVDTNTIWDTATQRLLIAKGIEYTPEIHATVRLQLAGGAGGLKHGCGLLKQMFNLSDTVEQLALEKKQHAHDQYVEGIKFIDGFETFHSTLSGQGVPSGIATNADEHTLELTNKALKLDRFFGNHMYSIARVNHMGKPHPAIYEHVAQQLGYAPKECIAIEDSAAGIASAKAAGMYCIGINSHRNRAALAQADIIIDHYNEIDFIEFLIKV